MTVIWLPSEKAKHKKKYYESKLAVKASYVSNIMIFVMLGGAYGSGLF